MNEIPTVPTCYLAKPQPRERAWQNQRGKKTLFNPRVDPGVGNSTCAAGLQCMRCGRVAHTPPAHTPHFCLFRRRDPASLRSSIAQSPVLGAFAVFLRTSKFEKSRWHMRCTPAPTVLARPPPSFCGGLKPAPAFTPFDSPAAYMLRAPLSRQRFRIKMWIPSRSPSQPYYVWDRSISLGFQKPIFCRTNQRIEGVAEKDDVDKLPNIQNLKPDCYRLTSCCTTEDQVKEAESLEVCAGQFVHDDRDILDGRFSLVFGSPESWLLNYC
ncbi:hypothetical protein F2P79_023976 [Pimephales promelas]|nr:hypothetical protein F2P79_023976 [Pimephales promelas]